MQDFEAALDEVQPAFGANAESLQKNVMQVGIPSGLQLSKKLVSVPLPVRNPLYSIMP